MDTTDMGEKLKDALVTVEQLDQCPAEMTEEIDRDYVGKEIFLVSVLRGAVVVVADLSRKIHTPPEMNWMAVSSYGPGTKSSGVARILKDLDQDVSGRHVPIAEDIVDLGFTLPWLRMNLLSRGTASVRIVTVLHKPAAAKVEVEVAYVGSEIPNGSVAGYGLSYVEKYRNPPFAGTLVPHAYEN